MSNPFGIEDICITLSGKDGFYGIYLNIPHKSYCGFKLDNKMGIREPLDEFTCTRMVKFVVGFFGEKSP